jgi:hypothetical protein
MASNAKLGRVPLHSAVLRFEILDNHVVEFRQVIPVAAPGYSIGRLTVWYGVGRKFPNAVPNMELR